MRDWAQLLSSVDYKAVQVSLSTQVQQLSSAFWRNGGSLPIWGLISANLLAPPYITCCNKTGGSFEQVRDKLP